MGRFLSYFGRANNLVVVGPLALNQYSITSGKTMEKVFNAVVQLLNTACEATGLSYFEINILLYTFFIPATWWAIVWWRLRKWPIIWLLHLGAPLIYFFKKEALEQFSERFYHANTQALLHLGNGEESGYVRVSIFVGIVLPVLIYLGLGLSPKRLLAIFYIGLIFVNTAWYLWVWFQAMN